MESFTTKFGTPERLRFREYDKNYYGTDIDLEARAMGTCLITEYDEKLYSGQEEVIHAVKSNCVKHLQACLDEWPEGESVMKNVSKKLSGMYDAKLLEIGITAKTDIMGFNLTPDSDELYKQAMKIENDYVKGGRLIDGWDYVNFDGMGKKVPERQPGYYRLLGVNENMFGFTSERIDYLPGEHVTVMYHAVMTDTSYKFIVDAPDFKVDYMNGGGSVKIDFTMPEHDVVITCETRNTMMYNPGNITGFPPYPGMMVDALPKANGNETDGWVCSACGSKNPPCRFCPECGSPRP